MKKIKTFKQFVNESTEPVLDSPSESVNEGKLKKGKKYTLFPGKDWEVNDIEYMGIKDGDHIFKHADNSTIIIPDDDKADLKIQESVDEGEGWIEAMDYNEIANSLGKVASLWDEWKGGPATETSHIKPAAKELKGWISRWMKHNIK